MAETLRNARSDRERHCRTVPGQGSFGDQFSRDSMTAHPGIDKSVGPALTESCGGHGFEARPAPRALPEMRAGSRRILVVSPHLDDAVLSVGATLDMLSGDFEIIVVTVFAGTPTSAESDVARAFHGKCGFADGEAAMKHRRQEDARALSFLNVGHVHLDLQDAIFRVDEAGAPLFQHEDELFRGAAGGGNRYERELSDQITGGVGRLVSMVRPAALWTCAGIGGHVDHLVTARATRRVGEEAGIPVHHWEDLPYALDAPHGIRREDVLTSCRVGIRHFQRKIAAIHMYESQVRMLWPASPVDLMQIFAQQGRCDRAAGEYTERFVRLAAE